MIIDMIYMYMQKINRICKYVQYTQILTCTYMYMYAVDCDWRSAHMQNIRGCKLWRQPEIDPKQKLTWANEIPGVHFLEGQYARVNTIIAKGDFHFLWECLRVVFLIFWGSPSQHGSLCNM